MNEVNAVERPVSHGAFTPLDYDPFEGDFGAPGDKVFSDRLVLSRKTYECFHCGGGIAFGEKHRSRYEKSDGEMRTFRWCGKCCEAMVAELIAEESDDDPDEPEDRFPFERRHGVAKANAGDKRGA